MIIKLLGASVGVLGFNIYALVIEDICQVQKHLDNCDEKNQKQIAVLFRLITSTGLPHNEEKFRHIGDDIFELKTQKGIRVLCFTGGPRLSKSLVLTYSFNKPNKKEFKREKARTIELKHQYLNEEIQIMEHNS